MLEMSKTHTRICYFGLIDWSVDRNRKFTLQLLNQPDIETTQLDRKGSFFCELGNQCLTWPAARVRLIVGLSGRNQRTGNDEN